MARRTSSPEARIADLEGQVGRLTKAVRSLEGRVAVERDRAQRLAKEVAAQRAREKVVLAALDLRPMSKAGAKGRLGEVQRSVVSLQEYLLRTTERIDNILTALKEHRGFLVELDKRVVHTGTRDRIRLELDIMKNTLSILALAGVDVDDALPREIEKVKAASLKQEADLEDLRRTKEALDKRYEEELKRFDLEAIWAKRREIPGYR
jgi:chromosome segregation ATPase